MSANITDVIREIQLIVAPAVMISSSALLLLGFQNRHVAIVARFRTLNHERRLLEAGSRQPWQQQRYENLSVQTKHLLERAKHIKNAILLAYGAIISFLLSCVLIFLSARLPMPATVWVISTFLLGLLLELAACIMMMVEVALAFRVVEIESRS